MIFPAGVPLSVAKWDSSGGIASGAGGNIEVVIGFFL